MALIDNILEHENNVAKTIPSKIRAKSYMLKLVPEKYFDSVLHVYLARNKIMVTYAASNLTETELDKIIVELEAPVGECKTPEIESAKRDWIQKSIEFCHKLISQEADTFDNAVRKQFGNAAQYKAALDTIAKAEFDYLNALCAAIPALKTFGIDKKAVEVSEELRNESVKNIFG